MVFPHPEGVGPTWGGPGLGRLGAPPAPGAAGGGGAGVPGAGGGALGSSEAKPKWVSLFFEDTLFFYVLSFFLGGGLSKRS